LAGKTTVGTGGTETQWVGAVRFGIKGRALDDVSNSSSSARKEYIAREPVNEKEMTDLHAETRNEADAYIRPGNKTQTTGGRENKVPGGVRDQPSLGRVNDLGPGCEKGDETRKVQGGQKEAGTRRNGGKS